VGRRAELLVPWARFRPGAIVIDVPQAAIDLAKQFEGFHRVPKHDAGRAHPYICPAGYWTIGYGHLCQAEHPPITEEEGEWYLATDLQVALNGTLRYCPALITEHEGRLAAIVDFTFNLGAGRLQTSTLRRRVNQRDWGAAANELNRWVRGGGRILAGLVARRNAERQLLLS
jgi:lysozyme